MLKKIRDLKTGTKISLDLILLLAPFFAYLLFMQFKVDANEKSIDSVRQDQKIYNENLSKVSNDLSEIKGELKKMNEQSMED